ncbi:citrate:proton symporter [Streptomyces sp. WMMC500]|uniref:CitMHS family transporter n=1 Tax=Streptomyces sp. WMMC500 TaxID=3015154 RepID=UPI00248BABE3|nr:citrate:proton symporter [Streptomyces sp. WMMC500]WBB64079.1 citrate:proton symporter [Streptomyces sp. WMMC500]
MVSAVGFLTIGVILALLLTNRVTAVVALAGVPVLGALVAGFTPSEIGTYVGEGLGGVAGVAAMFVFAIVYFGVMRDAGLFDPIITRIVAFAGNAPTTICVATTVLAVAAHLDGAGATTFLITIPAMLPLFDRLGMSRLVLASCVGLGAGVMNVLPWGGPAARAATTAETEANDLWVPLIPAQAVGLLTAVLIAWLLGHREQRRLAGVPRRDRAQTAVPAGGEKGDRSGGRPSSAPPSAAPPSSGAAGNEPASRLERPRLFWFNAALTVALIACLVSEVAPPETLFMAAVVVALVVNYPGMKRQTERIEAHARGAMLMATTLLAAGAFLGILEGTGMIEAMARDAAELIPDGAAPALPLIAGILGVPLSLLFGPDAYYFGVLPVLIGVGEEFGVSGADIAQASLLGEETMGFPISPLTGSFFLLVGLAEVDIGRHIRHLIGWAWLASVVMLAAAVATGAIPLWAS